MYDLVAILGQSASLLLSFDADLYEIIALSLYVSITATLFSCIIGLPLGTFLAVYKFPGSRILTTLLNAFMGLPPVVVGLIVYLLLSRQGPLGVFGLLYTPTAMIIAQTCLITPLVAALARQSMSDIHSEYSELFRSLRLQPIDRIATLLWEGRYSLTTAGLAGFGRAIAEVGAVMIVGGNIEHLTRVMTTTIALETSKGNLTNALALGIVLILIALLINATVELVSGSAKRRAYA